MQCVIRRCVLFPSKNHSRSWGQLVFQPYLCLKDCDTNWMRNMHESHLAVYVCLYIIYIHSRITLFGHERTQTCRQNNVLRHHWANLEYISWILEQHPLLAHFDNQRSSTGGYNKCKAGQTVIRCYKFLHKAPLFYNAVTVLYLSISTINHRICGSYLQQISRCRSRQEEFLGISWDTKSGHDIYIYIMDIIIYICMYIISVGYHDIYVYYHIMIYIYVYYDGLRSSGDVINGGS